MNTNAHESIICFHSCLSVFIRVHSWPSMCVAFCRTFMKNQALDFYMHDGPTAFRFELAGDLNYEGARRLHQAWRTASSVIGDRRLIIDMTFITSADEQGRALL